MYACMHRVTDTIGDDRSEVQSMLSDDILESKARVTEAEEQITQINQELR